MEFDKQQAFLNQNVKRRKQNVLTKLDILLQGQECFFAMTNQFAKRLYPELAHQADLCKNNTHNLRLAIEDLA